MTENQLIGQNANEEAKWKNRFNNQELSPELWAAKYGHLIISGDLRKYSFSDKTFQNWIHQVFEILHSEGKVEELRIVLLSPEEQKEIQDQIDDLW